MKLKRVVKLEDDMALALYESIDTPVSLSCYLQLTHGDYHALLTRDIDPCHYNDPKSFSLDYQAVSLLKKSQRDVGIDRKAVALQTYLDAEELCRDTNDKLFSLAYLSSLPLHETMLLHATRTWVHRILGNLTKSKLDFAENHMAYGAGSTIGLARRKASYTHKYAYRSLTCTSEMLSFGVFAMPIQMRESVSEFVICDAPALSFVPKNSKTDRTIEVQPDLNIFYQRGVGALIRHRLLRSGFPVNDQTRNQELARIGSFKGDLVTLDLSSASDTLSIGAVRYLLSDAWFELLSFGRTTHIKIDGINRPLEKFSAMGNGYTWELETLIFNAIVLAASDGAINANAYGDDMIYPVYAHANVLTLLKLLGFKVNERKTYWQTYFRESCGADFFNGYPVRPAFLKRGSDYDTISEVCYTYGNAIRRWDYILNGNFGVVRAGFSSWLRAFYACPRTDRHIVPLGISGGFEGDLSECYGTYCPYGSGWSGIHFSYKLPVSKPVHLGDDVLNLGWYKANLNGVSNDNGDSVERRVTGRYATRLGYTLVWPSYNWLNIPDPLFNAFEGCPDSI